VRLVEVSVSGGLVIASTCDTFQIGTLMVLDIGGSHSVVEVRSIRPIEDGASFAVGVLFVSLAPDVQRRVHGAVAAFHERNRAPTKSL
jgi:hypothetical protein